MSLSFFGVYNLQYFYLNCSKILKLEFKKKNVSQVDPVNYSIKLLSLEQIRGQILRI